MLKKTKLYKTGDMMNGTQYLVIFMIPVMICNKFGASRLGFILGLITTIAVYLINKQANSGAINHYVWYCMLPTYIEGNTSPNDEILKKLESGSEEGEI